ncbi:MAG: hypothetical protein Q4F72_08225 [Desulfovibrionaceae bacterium]|nr:hypothetical protein [Desulfovibrionaceae bacterium]
MPDRERILAFAEEMGALGVTPGKYSWNDAVVFFPKYGGFAPAGSPVMILAREHMIWFADEEEYAAYIREHPDEMPDWTESMEEDETPPHLLPSLELSF